MDQCKNCGELLLPARPLVDPDLSAWVEQQMRQRTKLGIETDVADLKTLRQWAAQERAHDSLATFASFGATTATATTPVAEIADPAPSVAKAVCPSCATEYTESVKFCSECGTATQPPDTGVQVARLEHAMAQLSERVRQLERVRPSSSAQSGFDWVRLPTDEKWRVTWGVWGRTILVSLAVWAGLIVLLLALGFLSAGSQ